MLYAQGSAGRPQAAKIIAAHRRTELPETEGLAVVRSTQAQETEEREPRRCDGADPCDHNASEQLAPPPAALGWPLTPRRVAVLSVGAT